MKYEWKQVKTFPLSNIDEVVETANKINGMKEEGFVIRDNQFRRVKIKSPAYIKLSLLAPSTDEVNVKSLATIVQKNEGSHLSLHNSNFSNNNANIMTGDEFLVYFPFFRDIYNQMKETYERHIADLDQALEASKGVSNKELASTLCKKPSWFSNAVFVIKRNGYQVNAREYLSTCSASQIQMILKYKPVSGPAPVSEEKAELLV